MTKSHKHAASRTV